MRYIWDHRKQSSRQVGGDGIRDGVVRSTGVFLRESAGGGAGTVQHVDMSVGSAEENTASNGQTEVLYVDNISSGTRNHNSSGIREARNKAIARRKEDPLRPAAHQRVLMIKRDMKQSWKKSTFLKQVRMMESAKKPWRDYLRTGG